MCIPTRGVQQTFLNRIMIFVQLLMTTFMIIFFLSLLIGQKQ